MKKKIKRLFPLGLDIPGQLAIIVALLGFVFMLGHGTFLFNFKEDILKNCYDLDIDVYHLKETYEMPGFWSMLRNCFDIWWYFGALLCMVAYNYRYHFGEYKCIYLMRRIPDKWEIYRRCWGVLAVGIVCVCICIAIMLVVCYGYYCSYDMSGLPTHFETWESWFF